LNLFLKNEYSNFLKEQQKKCIISETIANESLAAFDIAIRYVDIEGKKLDELNSIIKLFIDRASNVLPNNTLRFYVSRLSNSLNLFLKSRSKSRIDVSYLPSKKTSVSKKMPTRITVKKSMRKFIPDIKITEVSNEKQNLTVDKNKGDQIITPVSSEKVSVKQNTSELKKKTKQNKKRSVDSKKKHSIKQVIPDKTVEPTIVNAGESQYNFPVPIRENLVILIKNLPFNLKISECKKICSVIKALSQ
jgi:hypothetical protein